MKGLRFWQVLVLLLVACGAAWGVYVFYNRTTGNSNPSLPSNAQLVAVRTGNIVKSVSASGPLVFSTRELLSFGSASTAQQITATAQQVKVTVEEVKVKSGETVKKGQVLAKLDSSSILSLQKAVTQARSNLKTAQDALETAQHSEVDIATAEAAVATAKLALKTAQDDLKAAQSYSVVDIATAEAAVATYKLALKTAQDDLYTAQHSVVDIATAEAAVATYKLALKTAQDDLYAAQTPYTESEITQAKAAVERARQNLNNKRAALDSAPITRQQQIKDAENSLEQAISVYRNSAMFYYGIDMTREQILADPDWILTQQPNSANISPLPSPQVYRLPITIEEARADLITAKNNLDNVRITADNALITAENAVATAQTALQTAEEDLTNKSAGAVPVNVESKQKQVALAQAKVDKAEVDLAALKAGADLNVESKQKQVALAQARVDKAEVDLAALKAGADLNVESKRKQVALAQAKVDKAERDLAALKAGADLNVELKKANADDSKATLDDALKNLEGTTLVAPMDGLIASVSVEAGQTVTPDTVVIQMVDPKALELDAIVDQMDVILIKQGQRASISLDAIPDRQLSGEVSTIEAISRTQSGVVSYPVTIRVTTPADLELREGMSATATIVVKEVNNVLLIPVRAIGGSLNNPTVKVMVDSQIKEVSVTLGLSDDTWTEVVQGLRAGDMVVVETAASSTQTGGVPRGIPGVPGGMMLR